VRQAVLIRGWQPWRRSTGPKTEAGKARCAMNALEHGFRSRATIQEFQRVRYAIRLAARNNEILRLFIRMRDGHPDLKPSTRTCCRRRRTVSVNSWKRPAPEKFQKRTNGLMKAGILQRGQSRTKGPWNTRMGIGARAPQAMVASNEGLSSGARTA